MKYIFLLFILFSSNSFALYKVTQNSSGLCVSVGDVVEPSLVAKCLTGKSWSSSRYSFTYTSLHNISPDRISMFWRRSDGRTGDSWAVYFGGTASCDKPNEINPDTGKCEEPKCKAGDIVGPKSWSWSSSGDNPSLCLQECTYKTHETIACLVSTDKCVGKFISTESSCSDNGLSSGGGYPSPPPGGCIWTGPEDDRVLECNGDADGDGQPDPDTPKDPDAECSWDGDTLICNGGTFPPDTGGGDGGDGGDGGGSSGGDDGVDPTPPTSDLTGVIKSIRDFNKDNNANLERLNDTNTKGFDKVVDANKTALSEVVDTNTKGFGDVVGAINSININVPGVDLSKIESSLNGIESGVNAIVGTDISGANFSDCYKEETCTSLYESEYSQYEDLSDMVSDKMNGISNGVIKQITDVFTNVDISNAQKPDTNACFDFGFVNFGCFDFFEDFSWIWTFIRVCFVFTAIMTARKLVFGG